MEVALRDRAPRSDEDRKVLGSALEEIDRMSHLVDEMLLLATTKAARSPTREDADLTDLVQTAVARLEPRARSLGLTLVCRDTPPVIVPLVAADVHRALTNVVENALKFTPLGGTVTVAVEAGRTFVDVTVTDTGRGIAPEDLPRVKDPFYRGESARSTPGSGLGLAIVARILGDHRGTVEVTSTLGQGTRVRLRFPRT
jgi:signal transduction histidine kinase